MTKAEKEADAQLKAVMAQPWNQVCADCGASKPRFASITLAIFLCNRCYGIHRSVGAHVTRTKCVGLDRWTLHEVHRMKCIGNAAAAAYWARNLPERMHRPGPDSPDTVVERWIRDKYERKMFCPPDLPPPEAPTLADEDIRGGFQSAVSGSSAAPAAVPVKIPGPPPQQHDGEWKPFG